MNEQCIYLIKHTSSGLVKIGITQNWPRRCTELSAGLKCKIIKAVFCDAAPHHEKKIHFELNEFRLPQSEWFHLTEKQIEKLTHEITLLGEENKWRPRQHKKRQTKAQKTVLFLPESEIDRWVQLIESSLYVSRVDAYSDAIVIYGLEVCRYLYKLLNVPVGSIFCGADGVVFMYHKTHNGLNDKEEKCQDVFDLLRHVECHYHMLSSQKTGRLLLPVGTKIQWRPDNLTPLQELHNELGSYFPNAT